MKHVRPAAVAGDFYPDEPQQLRHEIGGLLHDARGEGPVPKALVAPHAGYTYSGPVAASGYALLRPRRHTIERVVLLGPSHRVSFEGLAASSADGFATPLGIVRVDRTAVETALSWPQVEVYDRVHRDEHSLEVQLPFLQMTLDQFSLVPLAVGQATANEVGEVLDALWGGDETLIVVSSDLSHYHDYQTARAMDRVTSKFIEKRQWPELTGERACGCRGLRGLLKVAESRGLRVKTIDQRNSGDTSDVHDKVVGYGSFVVY
ncbi:MAG: AmmeMemoRadiSam system protein B [Pirellulales bacterium]